MRLTEAEDALIKRVRFTVDAPNVVLPDDSQSLPAPRWVIQRSTSRNPISTLEGGSDATAEILVRVETDEGRFGQDNIDLLNLLLDRFPFGARFSGVTIREAPDPRGSFTEGGVYVTPVFIRGRFWNSP